MAVFSTDVSANAPRRSGFWQGVTRFFETYVETRSRVREIERLNAMSDTQLRKLGISRDRIVHHVMQDTFYI